MEKFRSEIRKLDTRDLEMILEEQQDYYSTAQVSVMKNELARRKNSPYATTEEEEEEQIRLKAKEKELEQQRLIEARKQAVFEAKVAKLRNKGYEGYYEYTALSLIDSDGGGLSVANITDELNRYALEGWRLVSAYANELGHSSQSSGVGGFSSGTNATIDQHVLILERYKKI